MFKSKKANMVIALLVAVCLWAYVTGSVNPNISKKYSAVPVEFINEDSLISRGLAVESTDSLYVDIVVTGTRTAVNSIEEDDIHVVADLYDRYKGSNYVSLDVNLPKGISLESKSKDKLLVVIDDMVSKDCNVEAKADGDLPDGMVLGDASVNPDTVKVYGTRSNVDQVDHVEALIDAKKLQDGQSTYSASVQAVSNKGVKVNYISTSYEKVSVFVQLEKTKSVPLSVKTTGELAAGYDMTDIKKPDTVEIAGIPEEIDKINSLVAEDVDISGITENTKVALEFDLPEGVHIRDNKKVYIEFILVSNSENTIEFSGSEVIIENLDEGLDASISESVVVRLSGEPAVLSSIVKGQLEVAVDASGLGKGEYPVAVTARFKEGKAVDGVVLDPQPVTVVISIT